MYIYMERDKNAKLQKQNQTKKNKHTKKNTTTQVQDAAQPARRNKAATAGTGARIKEQLRLSCPSGCSASS